MNELILRAQNGDIAAMNKIIEDNVGLVWNVVKRFNNRGYDIEDLFQIGSMGFVKAIKRFDISLRKSAFNICCFNDNRRNKALFKRRRNAQG